MRWSPTGWGAEVRREDGTTYICVVEKWSEKGEALVGSEELARLVPVTKLPNFVKLVEMHRIVAVVPAAPGWSIDAHQFGPYPAFTAPVAAWLMDGYGHFRPVVAVGDSQDEETGGNPRPEGELVLRVALDSRYRIVEPKD